VGDILLVLFRQALTIQLLRRRNQAILRRPFLICEHNTFNDFDALQTTLLARILQLLEHYLIELLTVDHFFNVITLDTVFRSEFLEGRFSGYDDGDWLCLGRIGVNADVGNNGGATVNALELFQKLALIADSFPKTG